MAFRSRIIFAVLLLFILTVAGVFGFWFIEGMDFVNALYMTIITLSTVGFGEVTPLSPEGRLFTSFLIVSSLGTFAYAITSLSNYILSGDYRRDVQSRKFKRLIQSMKGHIIVCGYGRVGSMACERLKLLGKRTVAIEKTGELESYHKEDTLITIIHGDASHEEVLLEAGIKRASSIITTLPNDSENLFVVLTARELNPGLRIISRASHPRSVNKLKTAGAHKVIMPDTVGGWHMAQEVVSPDLMEFIDRISLPAEDSVNLEEIDFSELPENFKFKTVGELNHADLTGCTIIGFKTSQGEFLINPSPGTEVTPNSKLFVLGTRDQIQRLNAILRST